MDTYPQIHRCKCCGFTLKFISARESTILKDMEYGNGQNVELLGFHVPEWETLTEEEYNANVVPPIQE